MSEASVQAENFRETLVNLSCIDDDPQLLVAIADRLRAFADEYPETIDDALAILNLSLGRRVCFTCGSVVKPGERCPEELGHDDDHEVVSPL